MKELSNSNKIKALFDPNITDLITFLDKNIKSDVYTGRFINKIYRYLEMMEAPKQLTASGQQSHNVGSSYSINNDT